MSTVSYDLSIADIAASVVRDGQLGQLLNDCAWYCRDDRSRRRALADCIEELNDEGRAFLRWLAAQAAEVDAT